MLLEKGSHTISVNPVAIVKTCFECSLNLPETPGKISDCIPRTNKTIQSTSSVHDPLPLLKGDSASRAALPLDKGF